MSTADNQTITGLEAAKRAAGGKAKDLAELIDCTPAYISKWKGVIPITWLEKVEAATGIHRSILRPDFFAPASPRRKRRPA
jgi:hypothetical protein